VKLNRLSTSLATLLCVASVGLGACGGPAEPVESPAPAKLVWGGADAPSASDEQRSEPVEVQAEEQPAPAQAASPDPDALRPGEIDIDAMAEGPESAPAAAAEPEDSTPAASEPVAAELQRRRDEKARKAAKGKKSRPEKRAAEASGEPGAPSYAGSDPCRAASFSVPRVRDACATGGRAAAKRVMKDAIGKATAMGRTLKCGNCHSNQRDYSLKSNAVADLKRWLDG
jgi:hypothetical protein